jgi:ElaB/YqjD/DUF883 family membrane-anchored ribosome-binding protein
MLARNNASCEEEQGFRNNEVAEGEAALRRASDHLAACTSSRDKAEVDLAQTIQDLADSRAALATATTRREEGHGLYVSRVADHRGALSVVNGAVNLLDDFVAEEASLVQLSAHTKQLLKTGVQIRKAAQYAPVIAMFAQMATSENDMFLDAGAVERIRSMLQQLLSNIEESLADYNQEESVAQENFLELKAKLEQSIRDLQQNQQNLEDHLEEMAQCILEEELLVAKSNEKINRNGKLLALSVSMCAAFRAEHEAATASRNEELELLATVRKMVRRRMEGVGASVVSRDDSFENNVVETYDAAEFEMQGGDEGDALEGFGIDGF